MKLTTPDKIIKVLLKHKFTAVHEFSEFYRADYYVPIAAADTAISARLRELARDGHVYQGGRYFVTGRQREGKPFSEWWISGIEKVENEKEKNMPVVQEKEGGELQQSLF